VRFCVRDKRVRVSTHNVVTLMETMMGDAQVQVFFFAKIQLPPHTGS